MQDANKVTSDNALIKIATGLSILDYPVRDIPPILELGMRDLQVLNINRFAKALPPSRFELFELFETPLKKWWPGELPTSDGEESLLFMGQPTTFCMDWALERNGFFLQLAEIDEQVMAKFVDICRANPISFQNLYVSTRKFLIEHPVVSQAELTRLISLNQVHSSMQSAYEEIPSECERDGYYYLCDYCGDALLWQDGNCHCRNWGVCEKQGRYSLHSKLKISPSIRRVKRGILAYIVVPGLPELDLVKQIQQLGLDVELWPNVDYVDIHINLPGDVIWGLDVKATRSPRLLGEKEAKKENSLLNSGYYSENSGKAFYVIPDIYYDRSFLDQFCKGAKTKTGILKKRGIDLISTSKFLEVLKDRLNHATN